MKLLLQKKGTGDIKYHDDRSHSELDDDCKEDCLSVDSLRARAEESKGARELCKELTTEAD